jgi:hypothetical protein
MIRRAELTATAPGSLAVPAVSPAQAHRRDGRLAAALRRGYAERLGDAAEGGTGWSTPYFA